LLPTGWMIRAIGSHNGKQEIIGLIALIVAES